MSPTLRALGLPQDCGCAMIAVQMGTEERPSGAQRVVNVVVVSPGDVAGERRRIATVIEELNRGLAPELGLALKLWRWETDASPGLHFLGPQGLIDEDMRLESADLVVGIFWNRLGTPVFDAESGTAHELHRAWNLWSKTGRPQVFVYFCERRARLKTAAEAAQLQALFTFREAIPAEQMRWQYESVTSFERDVRQHLTRYLLKLARPAIEILREEVAVTTVRESTWD